MWGKFQTGQKVVLNDLNSGFHGCHGEIHGTYMKQGYYILFLYEGGLTFIAHESQLIPHDWAIFKGSLFSEYESCWMPTFIRFEKTQQIPYSLYKGWGKLCSVG